MAVMATSPLLPVAMVYSQRKLGAPWRSTEASFQVVPWLPCILQTVAVFVLSPPKVFFSRSVPTVLP